MILKTTTQNCRCKCNDVRHFENKCFCRQKS